MPAKRNSYPYRDTPLTGIVIGPSTASTEKIEKEVRSFLNQRSQQLTPIEKAETMKISDEILKKYT